MGCGPTGQIHAISPKKLVNEPALLVKLVPEESATPKPEELKQEHPIKQ
jgi:hypothetical protein